MPARDVLVQQLQASIELLPQEVQSAWLDLVLLMERQGTSLLKLQCAFGEAVLHMLQERRLIQISMRGPGSDVCDVSVDSVMLAVARSIAAPASQQYRMTADAGAAMVGGKLQPDGPYTVRKCYAACHKYVTPVTSRTAKPKGKVMCSRQFCACTAEMLLHTLAQQQQVT
jgi:hypothetical protein